MSKTAMQTEFIQNNNYIYLLLEYSEMQRYDKTNPKLEVMKKELLEIELAISSNDIIQNTKIAFPGASTI